MNELVRALSQAPSKDCDPKLWLRRVV